MSGYRKVKRRSKKRPSPLAQERGFREGSGRRAEWTAGFRDKIAILVAVAILVPVLVFTFLNFYRSDHPDRQPAAPTMADSAAGPRAVIVDHLGLTQPNPAFAERITQLLEEAGYAVGYYSGEEVTVEFY